MLCPVIFYMDGATTGQFANLPIEQLKFTFGILNGIAREKNHAWRNLGYVKNYFPEKTEAKKVLLDSGHVDSNNCLPAENYVDYGEEKPTDLDTILGLLSHYAPTEEQDDDPSCVSKSQDLHSMLNVFLNSYKRMEETGMDWDLRYKGKTHEIHLVFYVAFIKGDTEEHDKHCGAYTSRGLGVQNLCRYCCCPAEDTGEPYAKKYELKSPDMLQPLVDAQDLASLKKLSQQCIDICWYRVRFGLHNTLGVHHACPLELLHWMELNKFKYLREMFFAQIGKSSKMATSLNSLGKLMGFLLNRQSERDLPRTSFNRGLAEGKL